MTLPASGAISMSQVSVELGRASTATTSLGETAVRTLAGVSTGAIAMSNLYGKSSGPTWSPNGGTSAGAPVVLSDETSGSPATVTITCSQSAVWNWTRTGSTAGTANVSNGGSSTSITFTLPNPTSTPRVSVFTVNSVAGGVTRYWRVELSNTGTA